MGAADPVTGDTPTAARESGRPDAAAVLAAPRRMRLGLSGRMTLALAVLVTLTAIAAGTAIWGMERLHKGFDDFALLRYRQMTTVTRLLQSTERMAAAAPRLITIRDRYNLQRENQYVADLLRLNHRAFEQLQANDVAPRILAELTAHRSALVDNLSTLTALVDARLAAADALDAKLRELGTVYFELGDDGARPPTAASAAALHALDRALPQLFKSLGHGFPAEIVGFARQVADILAAAETAVAGTAEEEPAVAQWRAVRAILEGEDGFFALRLRQLELNPKIQGLLLENSAVSGRLSSSATNLFVNLDAQTSRDRDDFERLMARGRFLVISVTVAAVLGALVVFVVMRRRVIARLTALQQCMADNAQGVAAPIPADGSDEISDMARSLQIFVRSLEEQKNELERLACTDALTGLPNRRTFFAQAEHQFARFRRHGEATTVMMLDLDHFKRINDTYGHAAGDQTLLHMARVLRHILRDTDVAARFGGEEFTVLLPATGDAAALNIAERLRLRLSGLPVEAAGGEVRCTVSIGVAIFLPGDKTVDDVLQRADEALYQAKAQGRDRVRLAAGAGMAPAHEARS